MVQTRNNVSLAARATMRDTVLVNPGNRYLEYISVPGQMVRMPNVIRQFDPSWEDVPAPAADTVIIERNGITYAIGTAAKRQSGHKSAFNVGKLNLLEYSIFAAFEPISGYSAYRIENLKIAVPDTRSPEAKAKSQQLVATHEFIRNGQHLVVTIASVTLVEEATAAYNYGIKKGLYQWLDAVNAVIDFGGGTSSGRLYSAEGVNLRDGAITLPGTTELGQAIQARLLKDTGISVEVSQILDGIENGSYQIGRNGASFVTHFASCRDQWLEDIRVKAIAQWRPYLNDLGDTLLVGGSALLADSLQERTKGRFKIVSNPQDVTILGMGL